MARNSIGSRKSQLQQAAKDCVGLLLVIVVAVIKLARALVVLLLSALMLAGATAATAAGAAGRLAGTQRPSELPHTPAACQQGAEAVDDEAVPKSPLSPPPTPVDLAAAAAATTPSPAAVAELLDADRPRLLNRVPSGTHRAKRAPDVITPATASLWGSGVGQRVRRAGLRRIGCPEILLPFVIERSGAFAN